MLNVTCDEQELIDRVPIGCHFRHYKGEEIIVLAVARHSVDYSLNVVYQKRGSCHRFGDQAILICPIRKFLDNIRVDGKYVPRFAPLQNATCNTK